MSSAEAQRQAAFHVEEKARARAEWDELNALYRVSDAEWEASEAQWREWVSKRDTTGALDPGRFHVPPGKALWQECSVGDEERFSNVLRPQHEECLTCCAIEIVRSDVTISGEEKTKRVARLAHTIPRLQPWPSTGGPISPRILGELNFDDLVDVSAWGREHARPAEKEFVPVKVGTLRGILPKADVLELKPGSKHEFADRKEYFSATKVLLESTDDSAMLAAVMHDPALLQRASVFWENKKTVENAISADGSHQRLSIADKKTASKAAAEAWELQRDLVRLEKIHESLKARIDFAKRGYSVNEYNTKRCRDRRKDWADTGSHPIRYGSLGLHRKSDADDDDDNEEEATEDEEEEVAGKHGEEKIVAVEGPSGLTESPAQIADEKLTQCTAARNLFFNTMRNFNQHNREIAQEDSETASTKSDPFRYDAMRETPPSMHDATTSGNEIAAGDASEGKAKKDSKVEKLMEDGISLRDLAAKPEDKKTTELRRLSINRDSSSRSRWHN